MESDVNQRLFYLRKVLRSHKSRLGQGLESRFRTGAVYTFWAAFCAFLWHDMIFWNILSVGLFAVVLGLLDLRSSWGQRGQEDLTGRGAVRYLGGTAILIGCLMLEKHMSVTFSLRLLLLGGGLLMVHHLIQELVVGALLNVFVGRQSKRTLVFTLMVYQTEKERLENGIRRGRESAASLLCGEALASRLDWVRAQASHLRTLLSARTPRTFP